MGEKDQIQPLWRKEIFNQVDAVITVERKKKELRTKKNKT